MINGTAPCDQQKNGPHEPSNNIAVKIWKRTIRICP